MLYPGAQLVALNLKFEATLKPKPKAFTATSRSPPPPRLRLSRNNQKIAEIAFCVHASKYKDIVADGTSGVSKTWRRRRRLLNLYTTPFACAQLEHLQVIEDACATVPSSHHHD